MSGAVCSCCASSENCSNQIVFLRKSFELISFVPHIVAFPYITCIALAKQQILGTPRKSLRTPSPGESQGTLWKSLGIPIGLSEESPGIPKTSLGIFASLWVHILFWEFLWLPVGIPISLLKSLGKCFKLSQIPLHP